MNESFELWRKLSSTQKVNTVILFRNVPRDQDGWKYLWNETNSLYSTSSGRWLVGHNWRNNKLLKVFEWILEGGMDMIVWNYAKTIFQTKKWVGHLIFPIKNSIWKNCGLCSLSLVLFCYGFSLVLILFCSLACLQWAVCKIIL